MNIPERTTAKLWGNSDPIVFCVGSYTAQITVVCKCFTVVHWVMTYICHEFLALSPSPHWKNYVQGVCVLVLYYIYNTCCYVLVLERMCLAVGMEGGEISDDPSSLESPFHSLGLVPPKSSVFSTDELTAH